TAVPRRPALPVPPGARRDSRRPLPRPPGPAPPGRDGSPAGGSPEVSRRQVPVPGLRRASWWETSGRPPAAPLAGGNGNHRQEKEGRLSDRRGSAASSAVPEAPAAPAAERPPRRAPPAPPAPLRWST